MIETTFDWMTASQKDLEETPKRFNGVVTGKVVNIDDPLSLGRVQVQLPWMDSCDLSPWMRVAVPMGGIFHGTYFVPNPGDDVLVAFEHGDTSAPYVVGSLWNAVSRPPLASPAKQVRSIRTLVGNQIVFDDAKSSISIQTGPTPPEILPAPASPIGPNQSIMMSPNGLELVASTIKIWSGSNLIEMNSKGITITSEKSISLNSSAAIDLNSSAAINLNGSSVNIKGGTINMEAGMVKIN